MKNWWTNLTQSQKEALDVAILAAIFLVGWIFTKSLLAGAVIALVAWLGSYLYHTTNNP